MFFSLPFCCCWHPITCSSDIFAGARIDDHRQDVQNHRIHFFFWQNSRHFNRFFSSRIARKWTILAYLNLTKKNDLRKWIQKYLLSKSKIKFSQKTFDRFPNEMVSLMDSNRSRTKMNLHQMRWKLFSFLLFIWTTHEERIKIHYVIWAFFSVYSLIQQD